VLHPHPCPIADGTVAAALFECSALHSGVPVEGPTPRHSAIFAYSQRPGVIGTPERTQQLFGRVTPEHLAAAGAGVRVDQLMD